MDIERDVSNDIPTPQTKTMPLAERQRLLSRLVDEFERRGWREDGHTALALVSMIANSGLEPTAQDVRRVVGRRFQVQNGADSEEIRAALVRALRPDRR